MSTDPMSSNGTFLLHSLTKIVLLLFVTSCAYERQITDRIVIWKADRRAAQLLNRIRKFFDTMEIGL